VPCEVPTTTTGVTLERMPEPQTDNSSGTTQSPIAVVERFLDAMRAKDVEGILALMSESIEWQTVPFPPQRGKASVERVLRAMARISSDIQIEVRNIAERSGTVLTERTDRVHARFLDLDLWVCGTFEVVDGKVTLWREYMDIGQLALQCLTSPLRALMRAQPRQSAQ
jgi:limonene-1,2-epoxide hydrolase